MGDFILYLKSKDFKRSLALAFGIFFLLIISMYFFLMYYTRHGEYRKVPSLKGLLLKDAVQKIDEQGLRYQIDSVYVQDKAHGMVVEQDPDAFTNVKANRIIYLTITTNNIPKINLPDIENLDILEAKAIIDNHGLKIVDTLYRSDIAQNVVLEVRVGEQVINPSTPIAKGTGLTLVLGDGNGSNVVVVPSCVGLPLLEAQHLLKRSSLTLGRVTYIGKGDSLRAKVISQIPLSDTTKKVSIGTRIDITIND